MKVYRSRERRIVAWRYLGVFSDAPTWAWGKVRTWHDLMPDAVVYTDSGESLLRPGDFVVSPADTPGEHVEIMPWREFFRDFREDVEQWPNDTSTRSGATGTRGR